MVVAVDLSENFTFHWSGRSVNKKPLLHLSRTMRDYEIFVGMGGALYIRQDEWSAVLSEGEVLMHKKGSFQSGTTASPCDFYWLHFDGTVLFAPTREELILPEGKKRWAVFPDHFKLKNPEHAAVMLTELNHYCLTEGAENVCNALAKALLAELSRQCEKAEEPQKSKRLADLFGYVDLHFTEDLSLSVLAEYFGYNPKYLSRVFKREKGKGLSFYLTEKRVEKAKGMLSSGTLPVKEVALRCGFSDEYYFMRVFRKKTGLSPSAYRKAFPACRYT